MILLRGSVKTSKGGIPFSIRAIALIPSRVMLSEVCRGYLFHNLPALGVIHSVMTFTADGYYIFFDA